MFIGLLSSIVNPSDHAKCVSLSNQICMIQPNLINLHPNEYSQEFHYYPFLVKLVRCVGGFNTINDFCNEVSILNKTEDLNLSVSNTITGMNESKTLTKHISCECKCKFHGTKCDPNQWWNNDKCQFECKKRHLCEADYVRNLSTCICKKEKYLASIMDVQ